MMEFVDELLWGCLHASSQMAFVCAWTGRVTPWDSADSGTPDSLGGSFVTQDATSDLGMLDLGWYQRQLVEIASAAAQLSLHRRHLHLALLAVRAVVSSSHPGISRDESESDSAAY